MKFKSFLFFYTILVIAVACKRSSSPPNIFVKNSDSLLLKTDHGWTYHNKPFNGYVIEVELNDRIVYKLPIVDGLEQGLAIGYYNRGEKLLERVYVKGEKQGVFKQWWPNGNLRYLFNYHSDKYDGKQLVFFHFGKLQEEKNYKNGIENGVQRIWDSAGNLISNYTVKNNKIYGVLSAKDCMPVAH